ncbi:hypothetical protein L6164_014278 [Bauhinia variegata]|uniref:Uncharacterized protein n=1 Tax=Bauhinia variegata TaxID=167791 RepID=A0ACB9NHJ2_BAUVA|nr:hypothetical protein L6164_014278 [Bauhinia variegata]
MAGDVLVSEGIQLAKSVQEMSMNGDEPPPQFFVKESGFAYTAASCLNQIPIIDVTLLSSKHELEKLRSALSSSGCFQAINHGMSSSFLDKVRDVGKQFFALPVAEKSKYARAVNESEGYGLDTIVSEKQVLDWSYRLALRVLPRDQRRLALWPKNPTHFSETLDEFVTKTKSMMDYLLRSMARSLNLEED